MIDFTIYETSYKGLVSVAEKNGGGEIAVFLPSDASANINIAYHGPKDGKGWRPPSVQLLEGCLPGDIDSLKVVASKIVASLEGIDFSAAPKDSL